MAPQCLWSMQELARHGAEASRREPRPLVGHPGAGQGRRGESALYVWFDAPIGYISNTRELLPDSWETWWKDSSTRLIHFIGKDNICLLYTSDAADDVYQV